MTEPVGKDQISMPQSIAWQSNVWHGVTLDLPKVLASKLTAKEMDDIPIENIRLRQQKGDADAVLDLQSIFVFAPWQPEDKVKVHAYDASGIEGITWSYEDTTESTVVAPATLMAESQGNRWMMMRAVDRAGNPSAPIRLPVADLRN
jgi:hypothetical protein